MTILETERLRIEEAVIEDAPFFYELLNSPTWIEYIGNRGIKNLDDARSYIQNSLIASYQTNGFGLYKMVLKSSDDPLGICGLLQRDYLDHPDIGFAILPQYERQGYTHEAAFAILNHAHTHLELQTIYAITSPNHIASQRLLSKIGMTHIQTIQPEREELFLFSIESDD